MSEESPPTYTTPIFNQAYFGTTDGGLDTAYLNSHYLRYPISQTGLETIANLATTNDATINGLTVGTGAGTGTDNTALGESALASATTASQNTAVGHEALYATTANGNQTAVGFHALRNATGSNNLAIGYRALRGTAGTNIGIYNYAIGEDALFSITTGEYNTALGYRALYVNASGNNNIAIGYGSLIANTGGGNNIAIGVGALSKLTIQSNSVAVGKDALLANTGNNNTAIGDSVLLGQIGSSSGSSNTGVGSGALSSITTGENNVAVGRNAGTAATAITSGSNNTFIGFETQSNANNHSNSTALGVGAAIGKSNQVVLGTANETVVIGGGTIATTNYNPNHKLLLCGAAGSSSNIGFTLTSGTTDADCKRWGDGPNGYGTGSAYFIYAVNDNGTTTQNYLTAAKYKTGGTTFRDLILNSSGGSTLIANLTTNGTVITTGGAGLLSISSDRRLKENIKYYEEDSIEKILQLKPATYNLIGKQDEYLGFIAQDVEQVIPEAIDGKKYEYNWLVDEEKKPILDGDGNFILDYTSPRYRGLNNIAITAVLVKAFQQQNQYIKKLEERILALEQK